MSRSAKHSNPKRTRTTPGKPVFMRKPGHQPARKTDPLEGVTEDVISVNGLTEMSNAMRLTPHGLEPDWPARLNAMKLILAYAVGMPVSRKEIKERSPVTKEAVFDSILKRPGYRRALRNYLEFIDRNEAANSAAASEPTDGTPSTP